ncbi:MAG: MBL fold metallo-hydrolase [Cytophagales bacterium]|nr:MBL fold metallo-hydrolase [Cytophagales bacterium]
MRKRYKYIMAKRLVLRLLAVLVIVAGLCFIGIMAFMNFSFQFGAPPSGMHLERISKSANYDGDKFVNPIPTSMDMDFKDGANVLFEWMFKGKDRKPGKAIPVYFENTEISHADTFSVITWYGHSAISVKMDGKHILLDPMFGDAASPVSFMAKRFKYAKPIDVELLPKIDAVILSHDHYDHLDYTSIMKLKDRVNHYYTPLGVGSHLKEWGIGKEKITELDWWESSNIDNIEITAAPARHFSGRGLTDRNKTQWASWVLRGNHEKIYFSGDSGYGPHFKEIGEKHGPFDFAMMECGQYNEKWEEIHMLPEQTVRATMDVQSASMMPIHWSAFNLSLHTWTDPVERAVKAAQSNGIKIITPGIGERFSPGKYSDKDTYWWSVL